MSKFNLIVLFENEQIIKAKAERFSAFTPLLDELRLKFGDERKRRQQ